MSRRVKLFTKFFAFGFSFALILAENGYTNPVDDGTMSLLETYSSGYIEPILEQTRSKIKSQFSKHNFNESSVTNLDDLLMESGGQPLRSLIISTWRSGSTFLGDLLNAVPGTFYHYEPLLSYGATQIRGGPRAEGALAAIKKMFKCNFQGGDGYFEAGRKYVWQFTPNKRLWNYCKDKKELCDDAEFTSKFCRLFPFQAMKIIRLRLWLVEKILGDDELNVKVVLLIRDPRAVMQSRYQRNYCSTSTDCWEPDKLCADMVSDYYAARHLLPIYPDRLMIVRFEEMALNPKATAHRILKFLNLNVTSSVEEFLKSHTEGKGDEVGHTFRDSKTVPFKWKNVLNFTVVDKIQNSCKEAMRLWGYKMTYDASHMANKNFNPVDNYTIPTTETS